MITADFDALMASLELDEALDVRLRAAVINLKPPEEAHQATLEADAGVMAASHRLAADANRVDTHIPHTGEARDCDLHLVG